MSPRSTKPNAARDKLRDSAPPLKSSSWKGELRESAHKAKRQSRHRSSSAAAAFDRPFVRLNLAITADGKIATANRKVFSFGSRRDLEFLFRLRRRADAILCGATTINDVNADLGPGKSTLRASTSAKLPLRVVVSGRGHVDPCSRLFRRSFGAIIILTTARISRHRLHQLKSLAHTVKVFGREELDFRAALRWLHSEWNVRNLLCEGGGQVNAGLLEADLVDEIHLTICPWIVGGRDAPTLADGRGVDTLADASTWRLARTRRIGDEMFVTYRRCRTRGTG